MFAQRLQLGREVVFRISTGVAPDEAPLLSIFAEDGTRKVANRRIPSIGRPLDTGLFEARVYLSELFSPGGHHLAVCRWKVAGARRMAIFSFEIIPGGNGSGQVTAMISFELPHAQYLVQGRSSGRIYKGKNPGVK